MTEDTLVLASASPRRKELLQRILSDFIVCPSKEIEKIENTIAPQELVLSLALEKAKAVKKRYPNNRILAADTVVFGGNLILGKPCNKQQAREMLTLLSGKEHMVYTGVCLLENQRMEQFYEKTVVEFYPLSSQEIDAYIATGEPFDKAGGYGIQGQGALLVKRIDGDYYNVMGLPLARVARVLWKCAFKDEK